MKVDLYFETALNVVKEKMGKNLYCMLDFIEENGLSHTFIDLIEQGMFDAALEEVAPKFELDAQHWKRKILKLHNEWQAIPCRNWCAGQDYEKAFRLVELVSVAHVSAKSPMKVAYYRDTLHLTADDETSRETVTTYGKMLRNIEVGLPYEEAAREFNSRQVDIYVEILDHDDDWSEAYDAVKSCMSKPEFGCAKYDTVRCYQTKRFGLPDNGLRLFVVKSNGAVIGRAIVDINAREYVREYGHENMEEWLYQYDFTSASGYSDIILAAPVEDGMLLHPYVYGSYYYFDACWNAEARVTYWELNDFGSHDLQTTEGGLDVANLSDEMLDLISSDTGIEMVDYAVPKGENVVEFRRMSRYGMDENRFSVQRAWFYGKEYDFLKMHPYDDKFVKVGDKLVMNFLNSVAFEVLSQMGKGERADYSEFAGKTVRITDMLKLNELNTWFNLSDVLTLEAWFGVNTTKTFYINSYTKDSDGWGRFVIKPSEDSPNYTLRQIYAASAHVLEIVD